MADTYIAGIDVGSTNVKVGVCDGAYRLVALQTLPQPRAVDETGAEVYDPEALWAGVQGALAGLMREYPLSAIGITGMAEPGVLVRPPRRQPVGGMMPWYDRRSERFCSRAGFDDRQRFAVTGLHNNYKHSVYKLLAQLESRPEPRGGLMWLQSESYLAFRLTGQTVIDPTLALRSYVYDLNRRGYDGPALAALGLSEDMLPEARPSGASAGLLDDPMLLPLAAGPVRVAVCGHDHVCAALAAGVTGADSVLLSLGTTGILLGCAPARPLTEQDWASGFSFGLHCVPDTILWQGGVQTLGDSVDWCKRLLGFGQGYAEFDRLLESRRDTVGEVLFFPYLNGTGPPKIDPGVRGGLLGLRSSHGPADIAQAVVEGIAYELCALLELFPQQAPGAPVKAVGGGTRNDTLLQVLADLLDREILLPDCDQAALVGACMLAAEGCAPGGQPPVGLRKRVAPRAAQHAAYQAMFRQKFLPAKAWIEGYK